MKTVPQKCSICLFPRNSGRKTASHFCSNCSGAFSSNGRSKQGAALSRRGLLQGLALTACLPASIATGQPAPAIIAGAGPRVASLDYGLASTLLSLGVVPVGVSDLAGWKSWVVRPEMPAGVADLGSSLEVNLEVLAALKPDLILTTPYLDAQLPRLQSFAPVLRLETFRFSGKPILEAAIAATSELATVLHRQAEARRLVADMDAFFAGCRARLADSGAPPVALVNFMDSRHVRIYGDPGLFHDVLGRIGLRNAWTESSGEWGFQTIPIEKLSQISDPDAQLIAFDPVPPDALARLARSPIWRMLALSRPGRFHVAPPALMFGMINEAMRFGGIVTDLLERKA